MSTDRQLLMVGQPETGKTTFLALLWLAILSGNTDKIRLAHFQDDRAYLNQIAGRLQKCAPALHTEMNEDRDLSLSLLLGADEQPAHLRIPDLSGETWREAAVHRHWPPRIEDQVRSSSGLLLFLHARHLNAGATIGETGELANALGADPDENSNPSQGIEARTSGSKSPIGTRPSSNRKHQPPTQVALVDALQLICEQRGPKKSRVSIVISAWDLVEDGLTPSQFVARNLPLLQQYLQSNETRIEVQLFGLSAQGGDFSNQKAREALQETTPVERASTTDGFGAAVGVHEIPAWALGLR